MVRISIFYPRRSDARFDFAYYQITHMPTSIRLLSAHRGFLSASVERAIPNNRDDVAQPFVAACRFGFESVAAFLDAYLPHVSTLHDDMKNYTNIAPVIQVSEVFMSYQRN